MEAAYTFLTPLVVVGMQLKEAFRLYKHTLSDAPTFEEFNNVVVKVCLGDTGLFLGVTAGCPFMVWMLCSTVYTYTRVR